MGKVTDGLLLPFQLVLVLCKLGYAAVTAPLYSTSPSFFEHVGNAGVRSLLGDLSPSQLQLIVPPFLDAWRSLCAQNHLEAPIVPIPDTKASGFWIGDPRKAKYFSLYVHGGGYVIPGSEGHLKMLYKMVNWSDGKLALFCVAYTLSPEAIYPQALSECVEGLRYMFSLPQVRPANTLLTGDSAGGAIVLAILSHISAHPHPDSAIVKPLQLEGGQSLKSAILINPFISSSSARYASIKRFQYRDTFNESTADAWLTAYNGGKSGFEDDMYICPAHADESWWKGTKCGEILCTAGGEESLLDSIIDWSEKYRKGMAGGKRRGDDAVKLVVGEKETHIMPVLAPYDEDKLDALGEKSTEGAIRAWIREELAS
ncbi:Monoterpene epsilon-lactone hydrolase [Cyphellophora attinorum]|uniref:Monoterpene epsilon-lactone hydrolase n=1 Tax=Cyphellophora attinorum TaxID=1664694 RepID=A0A0N0NPH4_9EURO|nr:Monoterpene epsilon-lactone hydrolase [Phialophora attinorum]KPI42728.1 Monoterpene epsilon-lactone hydrolase [Phialophora attinorum]